MSRLANHVIISMLSCVIMTMGHHEFPILPTISNSSGDYYLSSTINQYSWKSIWCSHPNLCYIDCKHNSSCSQTKITILSSNWFELICTAYKSCSYIKLNNISTINTTIKCNGIYSCKDANFNLPSTVGYINIECSNYHSCYRSATYTGITNNAINISTINTTIKCNGIYSCKDSKFNLQSTVGYINIECSNYHSCDSSATYTGITNNAININCVGDASCNDNYWHLTYTKTVNVICKYGGELGSKYGACSNVDLYAEMTHNLYVLCYGYMDCIRSSFYLPSHKQNASHLTCYDEKACSFLTIRVPINYTTDYLDINVVFDDLYVDRIRVQCYDESTYIYNTQLVQGVINGTDDELVLCQCSHCCPFSDQYVVYNDTSKICIPDNNKDNDKATYGLIVLIIIFSICIGITLVAKIRRAVKKSNDKKQRYKMDERSVIQSTPIQHPQIEVIEPIVQNTVNVNNMQQQEEIVMVQLADGRMVAAKVMCQLHQIQPINQMEGEYDHDM